MSLLLCVCVCVSRLTVHVRVCTLSCVMFNALWLEKVTAGEVRLRRHPVSQNLLMSRAGGEKKISLEPT